MLVEDFIQFKKKSRPPRSNTPEEDAISQTWAMKAIFKLTKDCCNQAIFKGIHRIFLPILIMTSILVRNIRGIVGHAFSHRLKTLIRFHSVSFLVILEPMVEPEQLDGFTAKFGFHLGVSNFSNKIWVMWKAGFIVDVVINADQFIHLAVAHESWILFLIVPLYMLNVHKLKEDLYGRT